MNLPIFAVGRDIETIQTAVDNGTLSFPAYAFVRDTQKLAFIEKDKQIKFVTGNNPSQIMFVDTLPDETDGNENVLYVKGDIIYVFDSSADEGKKYKAIGESRLETINSMIDSLSSSVETIESSLETKVDSSYVDARINTALAGTVKYEIVYKPDGTLVNYREKEIRILCPSDTAWVTKLLQ